MRATATLAMGVWALWAAAAPAAAQPPAALPAPKCSFLVKVLSSSSLMVRCGPAWPDGTWRFALWKYGEGWETDPPRLVVAKGVATANRQNPGDRAITVTFAAGALESATSYRLLITGPAPGAMPDVIAFDTKPAGTLTVRADRRELVLRSTVALKSAACGSCTLKEVTDPSLLQEDGTKTKAQENMLPVTVTGVGDGDFDVIGTADLHLERSLSDGPAKLEFSGLTNMLGAVVTARGDSASIVPKSATEAAYSFELGWLASEGSRTTYSFDAVAQPTVARWGQNRLRLLGKLDLGHNDKQSANSIQAGAEVIGRFRIVKAGPLFGLRPVVRGSYETDRHGDARNVVGAAEVLLRLAGLYAPRDEQRKSLALSLGVKPAAVVRPNFGYVIPVVAAFDFGGNLHDRTVGSGSAAVVLPQFGIARLRLGTTPVIEFKRLTITDDFTARWLIAEEQLLVSGAAPSIRPVSGWKVYNELGLKVALDKVGHFAVGVTLKNGDAAPTFRRVNSAAARMTVLF